MVLNLIVILVVFEAVVLLGLKSGDLVFFEFFEVFEVAEVPLFVVDFRFVDLVDGFVKFLFPVEVLRVGAHGGYVDFEMLNFTI